ncbi:hypothetical protein GCM10011487_64120 [Steroidobacter agaridevorans]|uniref:NACHT domain-containing protein n=2 Tax=Steroidobacter agaridevorans TaxID=2695856 RepID=A0A829YNK9_9GAMM|nr:hypothetical protein GCM10011487_64120 [Steroidobacter agaridevorans]
MQLLLPNQPLSAIAVEGLSPRDQSKATAKTVEIADLTLYHGEASFEHASRMTISQFKYSIANEDADFRVSDAKETIEKFADSYRSYKRKYGTDRVTQKLDFELVTNRTIYGPFQQALDALKSGTPAIGDALKQSKQFGAAAGLTGKALAEFAGKLTLSGLSGSLPANKRSLAGLIVDWSATDDLVASSRLGKIKDFVREKAGHAGSYKNLIKRTDILAELGVENADDLLPCRPALPEVGKVLEREQLSEAVALLPSLSVPLLVNATGGVGKTVFMESLASAISKQSEIVFFDCFGGGQYRSPSDARHLPKKGLIHIANTLAFRGLCDPILPGTTDTPALLLTFRRRLAQCVVTLEEQAPGRGLVIFIDAIDNAQRFADERGQEAFPTLLLESLRYEPIDGVKLVVSCRPERRPTCLTGYKDFALRPFTQQETATYLKARLKSVSAAEIKVAQARSGGNARVLEYLAKSDRGLLDQSEVDKGIELDDLIQQRIDSALAMAIDRGYQQKDIDAFLAGLAVLPPPVPLDEYASAHGMSLDEIESFASDLNPLLERTKQGLMFRDEPTETLVHNRYSSLANALRRVADNLLARQGSSVYAARALPVLLQQLEDGDQLFKLALDERIPATITSTVGKRNIRYARIKSAVLYAANKQDYNKLVRLLVELSTVASVDERGADYILDYPDLVVTANDADAMRRLFETHTAWPGARHARLAIANALAGDSGEAYRHARAASEWLDHYRRNPPKDPIERVRPERMDIAAIPFFLICEGRSQDARNTLDGWRAWYSYEVSEYVFDYLRLADKLKRVKARSVSSFLSALDETGSIAAALSFHEMPKRTTKELVVKLTRACNTDKDFSSGDFHRKERTYDLSDGVRKACALALMNDQASEALKMCQSLPFSHPSVWSFRDTAFRGDLFQFVFRVALIAAVNKKEVGEKDLLPKDLAPLLATVKRSLKGKEFEAKAKEAINKAPHKNRDSDEPSKDPLAMSYDEKRDAEKFLTKLPYVLALTSALREALLASSKTIDGRFLELIEAWETARKHKDTYGTGEHDHLFRMLGLEIAQFVLWVRRDLKKSSIERFLTAVHSQIVSPYTLIDIVGVLAQRTPLHVLAGSQAVKARELIQAENDVTARGSLFARLGRAILPASLDEASAYFHAGLEQMDAIGSGDYIYTNELLLFASMLKGAELDEQDFHTLSNVAELNLGDEPHKFFWVAYARGMAKAAGARGLAKLSRWDDRSKIGLDHTLYPNLIALVSDGKLEPELAVALNRLADPAEYHEYGTREFIKVLQSRGAADKREIVAELIHEYLDDNPGVSSDSTVAALALLAETVLGKKADATKHLQAAAKEFGPIRHAQNEHSNYSGSGTDSRLGNRRGDRDRENRKKLKAIARATDPADEAALAKAFREVDQLEQIWDLRGAFFDDMRKKVEFDSRAQYIKSIAASEHLNWFWKMAELEECRKQWTASSSSIGAAFESIAIPMLRLHSDAVVDDGSFSGYKLKELSNLTGVAMSSLVLDLIKALSQPDAFASGAAWLGIACFIAPEADDGMGQLALKRLLRSEAANLANSVADGPWQTGLYPASDTAAIASGLIWRQLGSPNADDRWRAAHSMRSLARFGRWDVIDQIVQGIAAKTAGPFQASELKFYHLHAKLWLLIALARLAIDHPREIARHSEALEAVVRDDAEPHVLMRHFAQSALVACIEAGGLSIAEQNAKELRAANRSPYPRMNSKTRKGGGYYQGRPKGSPEPEFEFHLDIDFAKHDVDNLGQVFGKGTWEVTDLMSEIVRRLDPSVTSMYESEGRQSRYSRESYSMIERSHSYAQQLGWHALFFAAGKLLKKHPVTDDWWGSGEGDPWSEWLCRYTLTRNDGLWLSDGTDRTPLDTQTVLLRKGKEGLELTGDQGLIKKLIGITGRPHEIVIEGDWHSSDNIKVRISSALVEPDNAQRFAQKLVGEQPMSAWIPTFSEGDEESGYSHNEKNGHEAWVVNPSGEARLDKHDPLSVDDANRRPRLAKKYSDSMRIHAADAFGRTWQYDSAEIALRAQAWGRNETDNSRGPHPGLRLLCTASTLKKILKKHNKTLLLLIVLRRSEQETYRGSTKWTHTVAVVSITKAMGVIYLPGRINHLHKDRW